MGNFLLRSECGNCGLGPTWLPSTVSHNSTGTASASQTSRCQPFCHGWWDVSLCCWQESWQFWVYSQVFFHILSFQSSMQRVCGMHIHSILVHLYKYMWVKWWWLWFSLTHEHLHCHGMFKRLPVHQTVVLTVPKECATLLRPHQQRLWSCIFLAGTVAERLWRLPWKGWQHQLHATGGTWLLHLLWLGLLFGTAGALPRLSQRCFYEIVSVTFASIAADNMARSWRLSLCRAAVVSSEQKSWCWIFLFGAPPAERVPKSSRLERDHRISCGACCDSCCRKGFWANQILPFNCGVFDFWLPGRLSKGILCESRIVAQTWLCFSCPWCQEAGKPLPWWILGCHQDQSKAEGHCQFLWQDGQSCWCSYKSALGQRFCKFGPAPMQDADHLWQCLWMLFLIAALHLWWRQVIGTTQDGQQVAAQRGVCLLPWWGPWRGTHWPASWNPNEPVWEEASQAPQWWEISFLENAGTGSPKQREGSEQATFTVWRCQPGIIFSGDGTWCTFCSSRSGKETCPSNIRSR